MPKVPTNKPNHQLETNHLCDVDDSLLVYEKGLVLLRKEFNGKYQGQYKFSPAYAANPVPYGNVRLYPLILTYKNDLLVVKW